MKILYISNSIIPSKHANSVHVMKMASAFKDIDCEVTLVATKGSEINNIFKHYNIREKFNLVLTENKKKLSFFYRLKEAFNQLEGTDILYTRWLLAAVFLPMKFKGEIIFELHSSPNGFMQKLLFRVHMLNNDRFKYVFITNSLKDFFLDQYSSLSDKELMILPDGADSNLNVEIKELENNIQCCYIGSFLEGKGVDTVVEIANILQNVQFHIVGGTEEAIHSLRKSVRGKNITWHGYKGQKEAMEVLKKCHIALLPNKSSVIIDGTKDIGSWTSPLKLFEYMSYGKAIVASDLPVLKEILKDKENSMLVDPNNVQEWVETILELSNNKKLYKKIASNAKKELERQYSWSKRAEKILSCYQE